MPEPCNQIIYRDYGWKIPCAHIRGCCPIHDLKASPPTSTQGAGGATSPQKAAAPPAPTLFEPHEGWT